MVVELRAGTFHERAAGETRGLEEALGMVGHELRSPVAGLRLISEFLIDGGARTDKAEAMLRRMNEEVIRLGETVENLLEATRLAKGKWTRSDFDLGELIDGALERTRGLFSERGLAVRWAAPRLTMHGDAPAIRRLVMNLLTNAVKHTKAGEVRVSVETPLAGWVNIAVADTGDGMSAAVMHKLGEPFAIDGAMPGSNYRRGAGLGIAICKRVAAGHGGRIEITSEIGQGTRVDVWMKLRAEEAL